MKTIFFIILSFTPSLLWLGFFYFKDKERREPKGLIFLSFGLGMLSVFLAFFLQALLLVLPATIKLLLVQKVDPAGIDFEKAVVKAIEAAAVLPWVTASGGFMEEIIKFLTVRFTVYRSKHFNEVSDGIIYSASTALGFAALESLVLIFAFGKGLVLIRGLFTPILHAGASGITGFFLGKRKLDPEYPKRFLFFGILFAGLSHAFYNFFLAQKGIWGPILALGVIWPLIVGSLFYLYRKVQ